MVSEISSYYNLVDAIAYFVAATIPIYFIQKFDQNKTDKKSKRLKNLTILLVVFIIVQGIYHIINIFELKTWSKEVLEPLSIVALIFFGILYLVEIIREKKINKSKSMTSHDS